MFTVELTWLNALIAAVVVYYVSMYVFLQFKRLFSRRPVADHYAPFVFVVIPAHNEEAVISHTVWSLLRQDYEHKLVLVMDDGSKDQTAAIASAIADGTDEAMVISRGPEIAGQGKGAVLNHAFELIGSMVRDADPRLGGRSAADIIICITDADGQLERHTLRTVAAYFADPKVGGVQIGVRIANSSTNMLARFQDIEFVGFSSYVQEARDAVGSVGLGGNGQFTRLAALQALGHEPWTDCLTEDLDLGLSLVKLGWRIRFCQYAFVAQQGVTRIHQLIKQRTRWTQGHYQCWNHIPDLLRSRDVPIATRIDLMLYLLMVTFVVLVSLGMVFSLLSIAGVVEVRTSLLDWVPAGPVRNTVSLVLSVGPLSAFFFTYQKRTPVPLPVRWVPAYMLLFAFYTYSWLAATLWAWARMSLGRGSWAKTARVESEAAV